HILAPAMDPKVVNTKLDRILAMRGDPKDGVGAAAWADALADVDRDVVLRALIRATRELLVPDWADRRKKDLRPQQALDAAEAWAKPVPSIDPVPYSPDSHFELGQTLRHKKFGNVSVTSVGETWIEVGLPDGTKKRLAHKP